MIIKLTTNFNSSDLTKFFITDYRYFVVDSFIEFEDVPTVKYIQDDYYETTEKQCVNKVDTLVAICDNLEEAFSYCNSLKEDYNERLKLYRKSEEYSYTRYYVFTYNHFDECFEVV